MLRKSVLFVLLFVFSGVKMATAQEENPFVAYDVPAQNLLKYNRFLINPTFSTVREDKSYINLLHRNQSAQFDDNNQNYFLSYSGRISDRTGLGLSLYTQRLGTLSSYGVLANYAYGVKLNDKSNFTFGANLSYYNSGFDEGRATTPETDPFLLGLQDQNLLSFQPGLNLSYGQFDLGVFAENLFDYNIKTSESLTQFKDKTFSGHLQYTHQFKNSGGILQEGRLMPLARVRKVGQEEVTLGGSLILDLPKLGWAQAGYDSFYGAAAGIGFNLNRRVSLGYTMEKGLSNNFDNFGVTHEISFAYSFTPNLTEDRVLLEDDTEDFVENDLLPKEKADPEEVAELKRKLAENDAIIEELMFRQDSLEANRQRDLERRFEMVMRMVRKETNGNRPDLERRAQQIFEATDTPLNGLATTGNNDGTGGAASNNTVRSNTADDTLRRPAQEKDALANNAPVRQKESTGPSAVQRQQQKDALAVSAPPSKDTAPMVTARAQEVKTKTFKDLPEVNEGYYVVANVYSGQRYLDKFMDKLNAQGIPASYIDNPNDGLKYAYLQRYNTREEAEEAARSNLNGAYNGKTWIMNVDNTYTNEAYASNVDKLNERTAKYNTDALRSNVVVKDKITGQETPSRILANNGSGPEYYIIANVFANPYNANRFVKLLNSYGLSASYFINPKNNYRYVYLKRHESWNSALISYYSRLNNAYDDEMWIMKVTNDLIA